jgi:hypothetical protein
VANELVIVKGDDYHTTDGLQLVFNDSDDEWPTLTSAAVSLIVEDTRHAAVAVATISATVTSATGSDKQVTCNVSAANSGAIPVGVHLYRLKATLTSGRICTLVSGTLEIV